MPVLADLLAQHPGLSVEASITDRRVDLIEEGFDLAIRIGELPDTRLVARRIGTARFVVCASPAYLSQAGRPAGGADLEAHSCVCSRSQSSGRTMSWRLRGPGGKPVEVTPPSRLLVDNGEALIDAALAGVGLIYAHSYMVDALVGQGRLAIVLLADPDDDLGVFALYPQSRHLSPKVRLAVDQLARKLAVS